ncbi:RPA43 OB domain-containing protein [Chloropicon primus]|uniref:RPA43 OB domain-containing protein n=1 Tax=Chloropicon primus TaxID=1764295 RepID=A0A5B8MQP1_9CHLO|nr:hypothetical protein A3770_09p53670 [Chloropicon primus]UPR02073.1 RPA43 OB domain-containing protein [Chloropicon primus]|eukprot:QDZ22849.1 hypothetical protein A3770_09p53670 [Chloropicon primus]
MTAEIHPSLLGGSMIEAAREKLDSLVLKWHRTPQWEGAVLSYGDEELAEDGQGSSIAAGLVLPFLPYVQVVVRASLLVFAPKRGSTLVGKVHKLGSDYIGMLVLGVFNAVLPRDKVDYKYQGNFKQDFDGNTAKAAKKKGKEADNPVEIREGCSLKFVVESLKVESDLLTIVGSMKGQKCGVAELMKK